MRTFGGGGRGERLEAVSLLMPCLHISHLRRLGLRMVGNMLFFLQVIDLSLPVRLATAGGPLDLEPKRVDGKFTSSVKLCDIWKCSRRNCNIKWLHLQHSCTPSQELASELR